jgi:hypothetical protein
MQNLNSHRVVGLRNEQGNQDQKDAGPDEKHIKRPAPEDMIGVLAMMLFNKLKDERTMS